MNSTLLPMVDQTPSRFGMSESGRAFFDVCLRRTAGWQVAAAGRTVPSARYRATGADATATKGHLGFIAGFTPGATAWRPPIS